MGQSTDATLVFGFDLGLEDEPLFFLEGIKDNYGDEASSLEDLIFFEAGVPAWHEDETKEEREARREACRAAEKAYPVDIEVHCHHEYPMYILTPRAVMSYTASRGSPVEVDFREIRNTITPEIMTAFKQWCDDHGVEWQEPGWLLCSYWG